MASTSACSLIIGPRAVLIMKTPVLKLVNKQANLEGTPPYLHFFKLFRAEKMESLCIVRYVNADEVTLSKELVFGEVDCISKLLFFCFGEASSVPGLEKS